MLGDGLRFLNGQLRNRHCARRPQRAALAAKRHNWLCHDPTGAGPNVEPHSRVRTSQHVVSPIRSRSMADEVLTSPTPSPRKSTWAACKSFMLGLSLSRFQAVVGTLAGIASITGAAFSLVQFARPANAGVQFARPANTGDLVTIVQAAGCGRSLTDATIEVLTTQNAIVATLTPDSTGRVTQELTEGVYVVRVSHPRYAADVRRVQVLPRQTVEIRASLRAVSSSPIERAVHSRVSAVRRKLRL